MLKLTVSNIHVHFKEKFFLLKWFTYYKVTITINFVGMDNYKETITVFSQTQDGIFERSNSLINELVRKGYMILPDIRIKHP
jgi:hypothetical protein